MEYQFTPAASPARMTAWLEHVWLAQYLDRRLSGRELAWFEAYVMDKPELLAGIEADIRLRDALAADAAARHTERSASRGSRQGGAANLCRSLVHARKRPPSRRVPLAFAATLAAGLGLGWIGSALLDAGHDQPALVANPTRLIYDTMRGEALPPRVEHAASRSRFVLVEVAVPPAARDVVLKSGQAHDVPLIPSPAGFVSFVMPRKRLAHSADTHIEYRLGGKRRHKSLKVPQQIATEAL